MASRPADASWRLCRYYYHISHLAIFTATASAKWVTGLWLRKW